MLKNIINFIKYNNAVVFIILIFFIIASGVFAQTEVGQDFIGKKQNETQGVDNTLLLDADLNTFDMDFKIEKIEADEHYYYVTYTYLDLLKKDNVWQYLMQEKVRKVSKIIRGDLGDFLSKELSEQYEARIKKLHHAQDKAKLEGKEKRVELSYYNGLIGKTLSLVDKTFPDYKAVKTKVLPSPVISNLSSLPSTLKSSPQQTADNLTKIYNDYVANMDPDNDNIIGNNDNCPYDYNPDQKDSDSDGEGDVCDFFDNRSLKTDDSFSDTGATSTDEQATSSTQVTDLDELATSTDEQITSTTKNLILDDSTELVSSSSLDENITNDNVEASTSGQSVEVIELN